VSLSDIDSSKYEVRNIGSALLSEGSALDGDNESENKLVS
jgi:hypothetical protein